MKLSPCKHCGSLAHLTKSVTDPHMCWSVSCSNLDCGMSTRAFSQQQHAVDAWQRCAGTAPTYVHRNGETEAPTVLGKYWFNGWHTSMGASKRIMDTLDLWSDGRVYGDSIDAYAGQWWGPLPQPWEAQ